MIRLFVGWIPLIDFVWRSSVLGGCAVEMLEEGQSLNVETKVRLHSLLHEFLCMSCVIMLHELLAARF